MLAKEKMLRYTTNCCDMIAMKREVAACIEMDAGQVFPRSECQVRKLATSHCTKVRPQGHPYCERQIKL